MKIVMKLSDGTVRSKAGLNSGELLQLLADAMKVSGSVVVLDFEFEND